MLGKNNQQAKVQKQANKVNRYAIKRLSVGVASVAVSTLLFLGNQTSHVQAQTVSEAETTSQETSQEANEVTSQTPTTTEPVETSAEETTAPVTSETSQVAEEITTAAEETETTVQAESSQASNPESSSEETGQAATETISQAASQTALEAVVTTASENQTETSQTLDGSALHMEPVPVPEATFSWQAVPEASNLIVNSADLLATGATIAYQSVPVYGQTSASLIVVYADKKTISLDVPITVTANAVNKTVATAIEEGTGTRAVATSPNTSGTVTGSITSQSATSNLKVTDTVNQTTVLDISGDAANYSGGYLEVRITNGSSLDVTPSP